MYSENSQTDSMKTDMILQFTPDTEEIRSGRYPVLNGASSAPDQAFTYNVDEKHQTVQQPVVLTSDDTQDKSEFIITSESVLPPGSPVFDTKNQIGLLVRR